MNFESIKFCIISYSHICSNLTYFLCFTGWTSFCKNKMHKQSFLFPAMSVGTSKSMWSSVLSTIQPQHVLLACFCLPHQFISLYPHRHCFLVDQMLARAGLFDVRAICSPMDNRSTGSWIIRWHHSSTVYCKDKWFNVLAWLS